MIAKAVKVYTQLKLSYVSKAMNKNQHNFNFIEKTGRLLR
jgi:hypothetical protein